MEENSIFAASSSTGDFFFTTEEKIFIRGTLSHTSEANIIQILEDNADNDSSLSYHRAVWGLSILEQMMSTENWKNQTTLNRAFQIVKFIEGFESLGGVNSLRLKAVNVKLEPHRPKVDSSI